MKHPIHTIILWITFIVLFIVLPLWSTLVLFVYTVNIFMYVVALEREGLIPK